jgi:hypothetical protein
LKLSFLTGSHQPRLSLLGTVLNMKLLCNKVSEKTRNSADLSQDQSEVS